MRAAQSATSQSPLNRVNNSYQEDKGFFRTSKFFKSQSPLNRVNNSYLVPETNTHPALLWVKSQSPLNRVNNSYSEQPLRFVPLQAIRLNPLSIGSIIPTIVSRGSQESWPSRIVSIPSQSGQ